MMHVGAHTFMKHVKHVSTHFHNKTYDACESAFFHDKTFYARERILSK